MDPWIVGSEPSERFPVWTRANVGEVFPDPVAPLSYSLVMREHVEGGWRDALINMGAYTADEFSPGKMEMLGVHGGYTYLNGSVARLIGERTPGMTAQMMDDLFFGAQPGIPPYEPAPGDANEERTAAMTATLEWIMSVEHLDDAAASAKRMDQLRAERPDFSQMSNQELWVRARDLMNTQFRQLFAEHIFLTFLAPIPVGALTQICEAVGRPQDTMRIISGVGDVESAAPAMAMWELGRAVAADPSLTAAFDAGLDGLHERLASLDGAGAAFLADFNAFIHEFGMRGPREWEVRSHSWGTRPQLALAAIDRMRLSDESAAPMQRQQAMAADRKRVINEISTLLEGDPETQGMFLAASKAAALFNAGRERTKTTNIKLVHECRLPLHTIGQRMLDDGFCEEVGDFGLLLADEIDDWLNDPASFKDTLRERRELLDQYAGIQEPFVFYQTQADPSTWDQKGAAPVEPVKVGDVLIGSPGCPGQATGVARVILDPIDPTALGPGEILVAPSTDPSWTPLFVPAAAVIVDVGSLTSHAMIVSRELGIPCVPSVTNGTRRIPDGATVQVNGDAGEVTILALPQ